ncbi:hypothetical protein [Thioalkalivibrio sp. HK1]|uniref:hypothetical protein n=1 Tax=Thioalkalivibrio sp. HK1 TaxID=1469245 RepID=UPI0004711359|nr:hypothetical protein [Thioalkalivibrio sp. HK1]
MDVAIRDIVIRDAAALSCLSPAALAAWAQSKGWRKSGRYREHSDIYRAPDKPELLIPTVRELGDYPQVVGRLISVFAEVADSDPLTIYRELARADRDAIRVQVPDRPHGSVAAEGAVELIVGAWGVVRSALRSMNAPRAVHWENPRPKMRVHLDRMLMGQAEHESFAITLLSPAIVQGLPEIEPAERVMTKYLARAMHALRSATDRSIERPDGQKDFFAQAVKEGVSANLCESMVSMLEPFHSIDIAFSWAYTIETKISVSALAFEKGDIPILKKAADRFRREALEPNRSFVGMVERVERSQIDGEGRIILRALDSRGERRLRAHLMPCDYEKAVRAFEERMPIVLVGDLDRSGGRRQLVDARVVHAMAASPPPDDEGVGAGSQVDLFD